MLDVENEQKISVQLTKFSLKNICLKQRQN